MKIQRLLAQLGLFVLALTVAIGCSSVTVPSSHNLTSAKITVSAAASLQDALEAIDPIFEQANPQIQVDYNFGASGALQNQIEQGAPTDVFISAAEKQMDALQAKNLLLLDTRRDLLTNQLVLIVPQNSTLPISNFQQLSNASINKIAVGEFRSVPAGEYAAEVFNSLDLTESLQPKLVFFNNVRGVLAAVESGNANAGVVYQTDAKISKQVKVVATATANSHKPIVYPVALIKNSVKTEAAQTYLEFLSTSKAQAIFQKYGFGMAL